MQRSAGCWARMWRRTVTPPMPESKTPTGRGSLMLAIIRSAHRQAATIAARGRRLSDHRRVPRPPRPVGPDPRRWVPVRTAAEARAVLDAAARAALASNVTVVADVAVAAHLALAAMRGAIDQAELNLASVTDEAFSNEMAARVAAAAAGAERVASDTQ